MKKRCFSAGETGEKIRIIKAYTDREEAEMITSELRDRIRVGGDEWSEAAILYRTNNQSLVLEESLRRKGIPYKIYKGNSFYDHKEIKDMLAYLRLIANPRDDEAFKRIINTPARGIGDTTVQRIEAIAQSRSVSMWDAVDTLVGTPPQDSVEKTIIRKVGEFVGMIRSLALEREAKGLYDFGMEVASRSGLLASYRIQNTPEATSAVDNIEELLNSMQEFNERCEAEIRNGEREEFEKASLDEWMQSVMLMTDMDDDEPESRNKVTLMTVHSAKGLEYKYVFIVGCEENLFPSMRAMETIEGLEEERRLFYVALTRAKCSAMLSCAEMRFKWGNMEFSNPSRFLAEIDSRFVDADFDVKGSRRGTGRVADDSDPNESAIDVLRRRFDVRYQQKPARKPDSEPQRRPEIRASRPQPQQTVDTSKLRRINISSDVPAGGGVPCAFKVGDRVEHFKFGRGTILRIEPIAGDNKLIVDFEQEGEKTLLARFAKLKRL